MERGVCEFLENLQTVFDTSTILKWEYNPDLLKSYIDKMLVSFSKTELTNRVKRMRASKAVLVANPAAPGGVQVQSDQDERTVSAGSFKWKRFEGPIPAQHSTSDVQAPDVVIIEAGQPSTADCVKGKASFWDADFNMSRHNLSQYLLEEDISRLKGLSVSLLYNTAESLLGEVTALVCMANVRAKEEAVVEEKKTRQLADLQKEIDRLQTEAAEVDRLRADFQRLDQFKSGLEVQIDQLKKENEDKQQKISQHETKIELLKDDVTNTFIVGFEAALEQVAAVHPSVDLSLMDPCKTVVEGKLVGDA
ncbi:hypothetical protein PHAVU_001G035000 [Phaseolus vulgaris]|nr:hypothetical protein PHAVU_001G035000g [Phaseolus vulgaris]ESW32997.1 hypothetical protein PHAVU_001G035000g [Phaseolus vulgaris]